MNTNANLKPLLESVKSRFQGTIEFDAPLAKYTYYRIGGPALAIATPKSLSDLVILRDALTESGAPFFILGWGSNLLCSDQGFSGLVIRMKNLFTGIEEKDEVLIVGASVGGSTLLRRAQEKGYGGLHHLTGIPGSVGGMVAMNAGTHLGEWKKNSISVDVFSFEGKGEVRTIHTDERSFSYRKNHFLKPKDLVIMARISYLPADPKQVKAEIDEIYQRRKATQPVDQPSCGSVFMNPRERNLHAWQVIDQLKLKGTQIGGAQFSEKHGNFIVNLGHAKAEDVKALIDLAKNRAREELGIELHEEVKYLGDQKGDL